MIPAAWFELARQRIAAHIVQTPLTYDPKERLYLKWENHQVTGSFKARGALNKVLSLEDWERRAGLVAASAGNHGQGVALAGKLAGAQVDVFVPELAAPSKVQAMKDLGASVHLVAGGYAEAERTGRQYARDSHKEFVSPYNDGQVIAGQGTVALEILEQSGAMGGPSPAADAAWIVPTGGGGLISACGAVLAGRVLEARLIGVQPAASAFAYSLHHRHTQADVDDRPTLAEGLSGAIEQDSVTIPMMQKYVSDMLIVPEDAIARAIKFAWYEYHEKIEGSAAVALAAVLEGLVEWRPCILILTGGNIADDLFMSIVGNDPRGKWN